jgi:hypothetical protein
MCAERGGEDEPTPGHWSLVTRHSSLVTRPCHTVTHAGASGRMLRRYNRKQHPAIGSNRAGDERGVESRSMLHGLAPGRRDSSLAAYEHVRTRPFCTKLGLKRYGHSTLDVIRYRKRHLSQEVCGMHMPLRGARANPARGSPGVCSLGTRRYLAVGARVRSLGFLGFVVGSGVRKERLG